MTAFRWALGLLLVAAIGLLVSMKLMSRDVMPSDDETMVEGFRAFADARNDLV